MISTPCEREGSVYCSSRVRKRDTSAGEFTDRYEDAVVELVRAKQAGMPAKAPEQPSRPSNVVSIMDALRKSIAAEGGPAPGARKASAKAAEETAVAPKPKAPSKTKEVAKAAPAPAAQKARKAK